MAERVYHSCWESDQCREYVRIGIDGNDDSEECELIEQMEEWLDDDARDGFYHTLIHLGLDKGMTFWFSDLNTAFEFKMRWG